MRTVPMCFSILQAPKCRFHTLATSCWESFHGSSNKSRFPFRTLNVSGVDNGYSRRWTRKSITTSTETKNKKTEIIKPNSIKDKILEESVSKLDINKSEISELQRIQYFDIKQKITENTNLEALVTVIVFDTETTGFHRENERIIEIALQDLTGGENSTFQTLVNPDRLVRNSRIHGITDDMLNRPDVPRMKDLIPILHDYVKSRQKPGGCILWVAHNARNFDVPFLINEFSRCSFDVPSNWRFIDTLSLARESMKSGGLKFTSGVSLRALREHYEIPLIGSAHRAMSDVNTLALIFQRLTFDLKMSIPGLLEKSFTASDLINLKKKKT